MLWDHPIMTTNGSSETRPASDVERLYLASRYHARAAQKMAQVADQFANLDAAVHAGTAVELMAKAVLADLDPRLLVEGAPAQHVLLDVLAEHHGATGIAPAKSKGRARTVNASMAVELAARLRAECRPHSSAAHAALDARNAAAHSADLEPNTIGMVVDGMAAYTAAGVETLRRNSKDFWGVLSNEMTARISERQQAIVADAEQKVATATAYHAQLFDGLPEESQAALTRLLLDRTTYTGGDYSWTVNCPACGHDDAELSWVADFDVERDGDGEWVAVGGMALLGLTCPICGLELEGEEVEALGIDTVDPRDADDEYDRHER